MLANAEGGEMATRARRSAGHVPDRGSASKETTRLQIRADLMGQLTRLIRSRGLTQVQAARLLGITQPRVSNLIRGKIDRFSVDSLIEMLGHTGARISVRVKPGKRVV
jgi:predicted XRE-type DNA-binding protein